MRVIFTYSATDDEGLETDQLRGLLRSLQGQRYVRVRYLLTHLFVIEVGAIESEVTDTGVRSLLDLYSRHADRLITVEATQGTTEEEFEEVREQARLLQRQF